MTLEGMGPVKQLLLLMAVVVAILSANVPADGTGAVVSAPVQAVAGASSS